MAGVRRASRACLPAPRPLPLRWGVGQAPPLPCSTLFPRAPPKSFFGGRPPSRPRSPTVTHRSIHGATRRAEPPHPPFGRRGGARAGASPPNQRTPTVRLRNCRLPPAGAAPAPPPALTVVRGRRPVCSTGTRRVHPVQRQRQRGFGAIIASEDDHQTSTRGAARRGAGGRRRVAVADRRGWWQRQRRGGRRPGILPAPRVFTEPPPEGARPAAQPSPCLEATRWDACRCCVTRRYGPSTPRPRCHP